MNLRRVAALTLPLFLTVCQSPSSQWTDVSITEFEDEWPFTIASGGLRCLSPGAVIFSPDNGATVYSVNGLADVRAETESWHSIRPIWKDIDLSDWPAEAAAWTRESGGGKVSIGPIVRRGLELCDCVSLGCPVEKY